MMVESASRQRRRYRHLSGRADLPDETRALGRDLAALVDKAEKAVGAGASASLPQTGEDLDLLAAGRRRIEAGAWAQADRVLTRARDLSLSDPDVLANLGWARLHNTERTDEERLEEGRDLLLLAEQLAPEAPEILAYTAEYFLMQGDIDRARTRARLLIKAAPASRAGRDLLARCEAAAQ
jgi:tetratricopeptide (TPR) repeat protein